MHTQTHAITQRCTNIHNRTHTYPLPPHTQNTSVHRRISIHKHRTHTSIHNYIIREDALYSFGHPIWSVSAWVYVAMCVSIYVCMCICACVHVCIYTCIHACMCMYVCIHVCIHANTQAYTNTNKHIPHIRGMCLPHTTYTYYIYKFIPLCNYTQMSANTYANMHRHTAKHTNLSTHTHTQMRNHKHIYGQICTYEELFSKTR